MDNNIKRPNDARDIFWPPVLLRAKLKSWWILLIHPANRRSLLAGLMEFCGLGLVLYGLYLLNTMLFIIGMGGTCLLLAQGLSRRE
jgi:hypothetical protein